MILKKKRVWIPLVLFLTAVTVYLARDRILESRLAAWLVRSIASTGDNFKESYNIAAYIEPADTSLYRKLLPGQFDMPKHPLVQVAMIHQVDVGPWPLTPYKEGCVALRATYQGTEGWYLTSLPVSTWVAKFAGRTMGYPKYVADQVTFEKRGDSWHTEIVHDDVSRLLMRFTPGPWTEAPAWKLQNWSTDGPMLNLMPPGEGPEVKLVDISHRLNPAFDEELGLATITIGGDLPWAGLLPSGIQAPASLVHYRGGRSLAVRD